MARDGHLEETLRRILAETLSTQVDDPRVGFVTVSEVRLNKDRSVAQVFYTVMGDEEEQRRSLQGLKRAKGFLRQVIGDQTRMRQVPDLRFRYDESLDRSFRIESILEDLAREREDTPSSEGGTEGRAADEEGDER